MNYNLAHLTATAGTAEQLPAPTRPEIAFVGRSNVGKSSLLNKLFGRKNLVKVSSKPGKTSTINFFAVDKVDFVDLPGYGFARVSGHEQERWSKLMDGYFEQERNLRLVVALIDIRHDASPLDDQMLAYLSDLGIPFALAFTKADKLSRSKATNNVRALRQQFGLFEEIPSVMCSAITGSGISDLRRVIEASLRT